MGRSSRTRAQCRADRPSRTRVDGRYRTEQDFAALRRSGSVRVAIASAGSLPLDRPARHGRVRDDRGKRGVSVYASRCWPGPALVNGGTVRPSNHVEPHGVLEITRHYVRELIYGANDGIITTFAVVAGVAGGGLSPRVVLICGVANLRSQAGQPGRSWLRR